MRVQSLEYSEKDKKKVAEPLEAALRGGTCAARSASATLPPALAAALVKPQRSHPSRRSSGRR